MLCLRVALWGSVGKYNSPRRLPPCLAVVLLLGNAILRLCVRCGYTVWMWHVLTVLPTAMLQAARVAARKVAEERVREQLKAQRDDELKYELRVRRAATGLCICIYTISDSCGLFWNVQLEVLSEANSEHHLFRCRSTEYYLTRCTTPADGWDANILVCLFCFAGSSLISRRTPSQRPRRRRRWRDRPAKLRISLRKERSVLTWYATIQCS